MTEVQHYVPRLLLRLHVNDASTIRGSEQVWCFDKRTDKIFASNVRNVLAEGRFNEIEVDDVVLSLETSLSKLEDRTAPILYRLIQKRSLAELNQEDCRVVAAFCAVQFVRTRAFRDRIAQINQGLAQALERRGINPTKIPNFKMLSADEIKVLSLKMLHEAPSVYGPHFLSKHWVLVGGDSEDPFHLGDHPVVLDNEFMEGFGALGLASPGISIYLPISPTLCLLFVDPPVVAHLLSSSKKVNKKYIKLKRRASRRPMTPEQARALKECRDARARTNEVMEPFKQGTPTAYHSELVRRMNSLQMKYAHRWIISSHKDFALPAEMIADDDDFRNPPQISID